MTVACDFIDPSAIRVSLGDWNGQSAQFGVNGNAPNPKDVSVQTGLVTYELIRNPRYKKRDDSEWDAQSFAKDVVLETSGDIAGTMLLQLIENRKLKTETFPGKIAGEVSGFTTNARIYER